MRSSSVVATIAAITGGDPAASARWRDVIAPSGLAHELRAVFRDGRSVWGALILFRGPDVADFSADEQAFVRRVAPVVASGFRSVLVRQHAGAVDDGREAGILVLVGPDLEPATATETARGWLDQLDDGGLINGLPTVVLSAARAARGAPGAATLRARTRSGRWVTVTGEATAGSGPLATRDIAIVVQPSRPAEVAQIVGAAHGLTRREAEVVLLIASGCTNAEIARRLGLSTHTVGDHVKNVFAKLEVVTRGELTAKLFFDHYAARIATGTPAGVDGWFLAP